MWWGWWNLWSEGNSGMFKGASLRHGIRAGINDCWEGEKGCEMLNKEV